MKRPLACPLHQESESGDCPDCLERIRGFCTSPKADPPRYFNRAAFDALCRMDDKAREARRAYSRRYIAIFYGISQ
jgi:hypothetical protein